MAAVIAAASLFVAGCYRAEEMPKNFFKDYSIMGTSAMLIMPQVGGMTEEAFLALSDEIYAVLTEADNSLSATKDTSCVSRFNKADAGAKVEMNQTAFAVLSLAKQMYEFTEGFYNPAVYYSVQAFGFPLSYGDGVPDSLPDGQTVSAFCSLASHFNELELIEENGAYYAVKPEYTVTVGEREYSLAIDLGGIGKGWCADRVDEILNAHGYEHGLFNFGSSSLAINSYYYNESKAYSLEIRNPRNSASGIASICSVSVKDCNLSTSGDYEQYYELENLNGTYTRYCHIINPKTGAPIQTGVSSVTVIGGSAAEDDAITTALSCMDKRTAVNFINDNLSDKKIIMLIFEGNAGKIITNCPDELEKINPDYTLGNQVENGRIIIG